jgi:hypothetical protein
MDVNIDVNKIKSFLAEAIWVTQFQGSLAITEMETSHLFNSMKMIYNHFAEQTGMETVWFQHRYQNLFKIELKTMFLFLCSFIYVLEKRDDLSKKYDRIYDEILYQIYERFHLDLREVFKEKVYSRFELLEIGSGKEFEFALEKIGRFAILEGLKDG